MKPTALLTALLLAGRLLQAQAPDGAFLVTAAQYGTDVRSKDKIEKEKIIKVFKNGYWIVAYFGDPEKPFNGSGGGTYSVKNGTYTESLSFYSWDSTAVGQTYSFDYTLTPDRYLQTGYINSDKYQNYLIKEDFKKITANEPLANTALEGVWEIKEGKWASGTLGDGPYAGMTGIKIYAYPMLVFGYYKPGTRQFVAAGGGTYQFDGRKLLEKLEYFSLTTPAAVYEYTVTLEGTAAYKQANADGSTAESWKRVQFNNQ